MSSMMRVGWVRLHSIRFLGNCFIMNYCECIRTRAVVVVVIIIVVVIIGGVWR